MILRAERRYVRHPPRIVNNAVILSSVEDGRYLGQLILKLNDQGRILEALPDFIEMKEGVTEDQDLLAAQEELKARLP